MTGERLLLKVAIGKFAVGGAIVFVVVWIMFFAIGIWRWNPKASHLAKLCWLLCFALALGIIGALKGLWAVVDTFPLLGSGCAAGLAGFLCLDVVFSRRRGREIMSRPTWEELWQAHRWQGLPPWMVQSLQKSGGQIEIHGEPWHVDDQRQLVPGEASGLHRRGAPRSGDDLVDRVLGWMDD
ncbi:MAG: hypothetical protein H8D78_17140 [Chloroflexi bacterium]|nr:hypothetical protein [Chloroflexota bacterium]